MNDVAGLFAQTVPPNARDFALDEALPSEVLSIKRTNFGVIERTCSAALQQEQNLKDVEMYLHHSRVLLKGASVPQSDLM